MGCRAESFKLRGFGFGSLRCAEVAEYGDCWLVINRSKSRMPGDLNWLPKP